MTIVVTGRGSGLCHAAGLILIILILFLPLWQKTHEINNMSAVYICWKSLTVAVCKNSVWLPGMKRTVDWAQTLVGIVKIQGIYTKPPVFHVVNTRKTVCK